MQEIFFTREHEYSILREAIVKSFCNLGQKALLTESYAKA
jgi:hypothetical protein